jgi:putative Holliday junction resolvase
MSSTRIHSSANSSPGRILAIDYGQKRIGLALSDEMGLTAQPLQTLERTNRRNDIRRLREIARRNGVRRIVVGHPVHLDGTKSEMAAEAARFATRLGKELGLPVELADERLSSWEAGQVLAEAGRKKNAGDPVDHVAAAVILRDYLAHAKAKK